ncbi:MAG: 2,3-bisphosphoglycerate-independent phosphoglycerate mutase [Thermomicrobiales bacterium]
MTQSSKQPVVLAILDGWGIGIDEPGNAILGADTPTMDSLIATYPSTTLLTSGRAVGLPDGQMGNSEVGHLNLGAGFVVYQWITRIDQAIEDGTFQTNPGISSAFGHVNGNSSTLHVIGLVGDGGVHSHSRHMLALLDEARSHGVARILVHLITDGRDTSPTSGEVFVSDVEGYLHDHSIGRIASVTGRYYAMDRDHRWDRVKLAFDAIALGRGMTASTAVEAVRTSYAESVTDEFLKPTVVIDGSGQSHWISRNDAIIVTNFRSDRSRELTESLANPEFTGFERESYEPASTIVTMTNYRDELPVTVAFPPHDVVNPVASVISDAGLRQFHSAETEKYPHVTFFFNGGREEPFPGEDRRLVPSAKVATYDLQPEMSAEDVCVGVVDAIRSREYEFILVNFANADMVGHSGIYPAVVIAVETVDACLGKLVAAVNEVRGTALITADHGNAERLIDPITGGPMTAHTTNPVPLILVSPDDSPYRHVTLGLNGLLSSVGTTVIDLLGLPIPADMTSPSLIHHDV